MSGRFCGGNQCERVGETMGNGECFRQTRWRAKHTQIKFVCLQCRENVTTRLADNTVTRLQTQPKIGVEKSRQVGGRNGTRDADANFFSGVRKVFFEPTQ